MSRHCLLLVLLFSAPVVTSAKANPVPSPSKPSDAGSCEVIVDGDQGASYRGHVKDGSALFETAHWVAPAERTPGLKAWIARFVCADATAPQNSIILAPQIPAAALENVPRAPKKYRLVQHAFSKPGDWGVLLTMSNVIVNVPEGEVDITIFDDEKIAGTFWAKGTRYDAETNASKPVSVRGSFAFACTGLSLCKGAAKKK